VLDNTWISGEPSDESRKIIYEAALAKQAEIERERQGRSVSWSDLRHRRLASPRLPSSAASVYHKTPVPTPMGYALIDARPARSFGRFQPRMHRSLFTEACALAPCATSSLLASPTLTRRGPRSTGITA
jgi:hypothetical protein